MTGIFVHPGQVSAQQVSYGVAPPRSPRPPEPRTEEGRLLPSPRPGPTQGRWEQGTGQCAAVQSLWPVGRRTVELLCAPPWRPLTRAGGKTGGRCHRPEDSQSNVRFQSTSLLPGLGECERLEEVTQLPAGHEAWDEREWRRPCAPTRRPGVARIPTDLPTVLAQFETPERCQTPSGLNPTCPRCQARRGETRAPAQEAVSGAAGRPVPTEVCVRQPGRLSSTCPPTGPALGCWTLGCDSAGLKQSPSLLILHPPPPPIPGDQECLIPVLGEEGRPGRDALGRGPPAGPSRNSTSACELWAGERGLCPTPGPQLSRRPEGSPLGPSQASPPS